MPLLGYVSAKTTLPAESDVAGMRAFQERQACGIATFEDGIRAMLSSPPSLGWVDGCHGMAVGTQAMEGS